MTFQQYAYSKYNREVKKLSKLIQEEIFTIQNELAEDPYKGKPLKGALKGWRSYGFSFAGNSYRIAYKVDEEKNQIIFGSVGIREGFYNHLRKLL